MESLNHYHGWDDGCIHAKQPSDGFDDAALLTEAVLLGNIAERYRQATLRWDASKMRITSLEHANARLRRDDRDGWETQKVV